MTKFVDVGEITSPTPTHWIPIQQPGGPPGKVNSETLLAEAMALIADLEARVAALEGDPTPGIFTLGTSLLGGEDLLQ